MKDPIASHFDKIAISYDNYKKKNKYYYSKLKKLLKSLIPENKIVLELGCGTGELLSSLNPKTGVGIDISHKMIEIAQKKYTNPNLHFINSNLKKFKLEYKFDYIFMADVIEHIDNNKDFFNIVVKLMHKDTVFINTMANPKWEWILMLGEYLGMKMPEGPHKRVSFNEIKDILSKLDISITHHNWETLMPIDVPLVTPLLNKYIEPHFKPLAFIEYFKAQRR